MTPSGLAPRPLAAGLAYLAFAAVPLTLAMLAWFALPVIDARSAPLPDPATPPTDRQIAERQERHRATLAAAADRVVARAPFYPPKPAAERPAVAPARYTGPALIGMVNDAAWFADGKRLQVGDEPVAGLRVLELSPPWSCRVSFHGSEYVVTLFEREPVALDRGMGALTDAAAPARTTDEIVRRDRRGNIIPSPTPAASPATVAAAPGAPPGSAAPGAPGPVVGARAGLPAAPAGGPAALPSPAAVPVGIPLGGAAIMSESTTLLPGGGEARVVQMFVPGAAGAAAPTIVLPPGQTGSISINGAPATTVVVSPGGNVVVESTLQSAAPAAPAPPAEPAEPEKKG